MNIPNHTIFRCRDHLTLCSYGHLSVISTYNPIYRMYNPIYNQLSLVNGHNCGKHLKKGGQLPMVSRLENDLRSWWFNQRLAVS